MKESKVNKESNVWHENNVTTQEARIHIVSNVPG